MSKTNQHPLKTARLHVFKFFDGDAREGHAEFVARFHPYDAWPIFFRGGTVQAVTEAGETFRTDAVEKHEQAFLARQNARLRAKETSRKKAEAAE